MASTRRLHRNPTDWLLASQFAPYVDAFKHHLAKGRYASQTVGNYFGCLAHFARWTTRCRLNIRQIDKEGRFGAFSITTRRAATVQGRYVERVETCAPRLGICSSYCEAAIRRAGGDPEDLRASRGFKR
jgi:hypothetical protein